MRISASSSARTHMPASKEGAHYAAHLYQAGCLTWPQSRSCLGRASAKSMYHNKRTPKHRVFQCKLDVCVVLVRSFTPELLNEAQHRVHNGSRVFRILLAAGGTAAAPSRSRPRLQKRGLSTCLHLRSSALPPRFQSRARVSPAIAHCAPHKEPCGRGRSSERACEVVVTGVVSCLSAAYASGAAQATRAQ